MPKETIRMNIVQFVEYRNSSDKNEVIVDLRKDIRSYNTDHLRLFNADEYDEVAKEVERAIRFADKHNNFTCFAFFRYKKGKCHLHVISKREMSLYIKKHRDICGARIKIERLY